MANKGMQSVPLDASHDYQLHHNTDERYYERLSEQFLDIYTCVNPLENFVSGNVMVDDFNICDKNITFKIPFTKGTKWHRGVVNQEYKDQDTPQYETRSFPLWQKLWTQYKFDPLHATCDDHAMFRSLLDRNIMRDLNDKLVEQLMCIVGSYNSDFCVCGDAFQEFLCENPLKVVEGTDTLSCFLYNKGAAFQNECLDIEDYVTILPMCMKSIWMKDAAINDLYKECCMELPPALSGVMPQMFSTVNGVSVMFARDCFFDKKVIDVENGLVAYKIPTYSRSAIGYKSARLDYTDVGPNHKSDGGHHRWAFYYAMYALQPEYISNDWICFEQKKLPLALEPKTEG